MEYEGLSHIIEADDTLFNKIWDENTSRAEEEIKEESRVAVSISDSEADADSKKETRPETTIPVKANSILKRLSNPTPDRRPERVTISFIAAENQSVVSTISKSTFHSNSDNIDMASVLFDSPLDREVSEITTAMRVKPMKPLQNESVEGGLFLNLYDSMVSKQGLSIPRCVDNDNVVEKETDTTRRFKEACYQNEIIIEGFTKDKASSDPKDKTTESENHETALPHSAPKHYFNEICFKDSEPIVSLPDLLASMASKFLSSSLSVDDISALSIYEDEKNCEEVGKKSDVNEEFASSEKKSLDTATAILNHPEVTLEEKRLDERSLIDLLSHEKPQDKTVALEEEESPSDDQKGELVEEENITEGLGLTLPPPLQIPLHAAQTDDPQDESKETPPGKIEGNSQETHPENAEGETQPEKIEGNHEEKLQEEIQVELDKTNTGKIEPDTQKINQLMIHDESQDINPRKIQIDSQETHPGKIEVDEAGKILINDEVDSIDSISNYDDLCYHGEFRSSPRDVYMSYRIEPDDNMSLSNSSERTPPKQRSGLKARLIPRWKINMKVFSGNKNKKNGGKKTWKKTSKSVFDSPSRTVETFTTATTASTTTTINLVNMTFAAEFPVGRRSLPNFIRPKTKA